MKNIVFLLLIATFGNAFGQRPKPAEVVLEYLTAPSFAESSREDRFKILKEARTNIYAISKPANVLDSKANEMQLTLWLTLISRADELVDKSFGPQMRLYMNVPPPAGAMVESGVSPETVKDPEIRAAWEADIKRNQEHAKYRWEQADIVSLANGCIDSMRRSGALKFKEGGEALYFEKVREIVPDPELQKKLLSLEMAK